MRNIADYEHALRKLKTIRESCAFDEEEDVVEKKLLEHLGPAKEALEEVIKFLRENSTLEHLLHKQK